MPTPTPRGYLIEFGRARHVGRFAAGGLALTPGAAVVVRSARGLELGTVLTGSTATRSRGRAEVVRVADPTDREAMAEADATRDRVFAGCLRLAEAERWPIDPVDVEPLLDPRRAVLSYLGPHALDVAPLRASFLQAAGIELVFEPVGTLDVGPEPEPAGCGTCGSSGGGCGTGSGGGCSGCEVAALVASRRSKQPVG